MKKAFALLLVLMLCISLPALGASAPSVLDYITIDAEPVLSFDWPGSSKSLQLPSITFQTGDEGVTCTLKGVAIWGVASEDMGTWRFQGNADEWTHEEESSSDQLVLLCGAVEPDTYVYWTRPGAVPAKWVSLSLLADAQQAQISVTDENACAMGVSTNGESFLSYSLGGNTLVSAYYTDGQLTSYDLFYDDEMGGHYATYLFDEAAEYQFALASLDLWTADGRLELRWTPETEWVDLHTGENCEAPVGISLASYSSLPIKK
ncbi:MAG: hypothetical protein E7319_05555 [Clostridiales bacterium]|nr:hypothetical protein [Clostridiales bacterium]